MCTNVALSVEEMPRAIISREYAMTVAKKDGAVLCVEKVCKCVKSRSKLFSNYDSSVE